MLIATCQRCRTKLDNLNKAEEPNVLPEVEKTTQECVSPKNVERAATSYVRKCCYFAHCFQFYIKHLHVYCLFIHRFRLCT